MDEIPKGLAERLFRMPRGHNHIVTRQREIRFYRAFIEKIMNTLTIRTPRTEINEPRTSELGSDSAQGF